jgi:hypothetical protein
MARLCFVPFCTSLPLRGAYSVIISFLQGSDFTNIYIRSTEHPLISAEHDQRLPDELQFVKFSSIAWTHDSKGFFYQVRLSPLGLAHSGETRAEVPRSLDEWLSGS